MNSIYEVIAEPNRRQILDLLRGDERTVNELVELMDRSQPAVSKHLRVLREAGLVSPRSEGRCRVYRLRTEPLRDLDSWLTPYRALWQPDLDALGAHLDKMAAAEAASQNRSAKKRKGKKR